MRRYLTSSIDIKEKRITKYLAILALVVSVFYFFFDLISEAYGYLGVYFILLAGAGISLILLKKQRIISAKVVLMTSGLLVITPFASVENLESGIYFYFIVVSLAAFTLFGYRHLFWTLFFTFLAAFCFLFVFFTDIHLIPPIPLTEEYIRSSLIVNYIIIMLSTSLMMFYLIKNNYQAEETLLQQRADLFKTAEELESSQRRFELAIQGSSAAIWDWDIKKDKIFVTPKLADILERKYENIQGRSKEDFLNAIHPDDQQLLNRKLEIHFKSKNVFEVELRIRKSSGEYIWILDTGQAEWDRNGNPVRMVGTIVDIHEKKLAVERVREQNQMLAKANQELDRFVYSTSHDLRAPLSSLLGLINLAGLSTQKTERDELISMMKNQIIKLDSYIQEITDYSRNARVEVQYTEFNLVDILNEVINNLKYMEGADRINFIIDVNADKRIFSDKERFKVIIGNLISNSIKYQDLTKSPYLKIESHENGKGDELIFVDNGIGIEREHIDRIFDMFYRASDKSRGSGLGLYIAKEITAKINATLEVESTFGKGTSFKVKLPSKRMLLA